MDASYNLEVGKCVKSLRKKNRWTQEQLAIKLQLVGCDMTRSAIAKIEVGQRSLYPDEVKAFLNVFRVSVEELLP